MEGIGSLLSVGRSWVDRSPVFDLDHDVLRVTCFHDPPYMSVTQSTNGSYVYGGYLYELWLTVAETLSLRYRMLPSLEKGYGTQNESGIWNGMVGELVYGRADFALTWLYFTPARALVVDYIDSVSVAESTSRFYAYGGSKNASVFSEDMFSSLLKPLHINVWWTLLASLIVLSLVLRTTLRFNHERAEDRHKVQEMGLGSCLFSGFRTVVGQGWDVVPDSLAARTVTIFTWVLSIIISVSYTANLISHLTVVTMDPPIGSLKEFVGKSDWQLAVSPTYSIVNDWKSSEDAYERHLYERVMRKDRYVSLVSPAESAHLALHPKILTYVDLQTFIFTMGNEACSLVPLPTFPSHTLGSYFVIAKDKGTVRQRISGTMSKIKESGILTRLQDKWLTSQNVCDVPTVFRAISFRNLSGLIYLLPLGIVASIAAFIGEKMLKMWRGNTVQKNRTNPWYSSLKAKL